jgi:hypothetical protein
MGLASERTMPAPDSGISVSSSGLGSLSRVFPPQATPSMPPLIPDKITQPPAYGIAGPVTRLMTRPEDLPAPPDDLDALAEKIRIILQEEAQRHGIAV